MTRLLAVVLLAGSLLPLANWIPGGELDPRYAERLADWALGFALCAVVGVLVWFVSRGQESASAAGGADAARPARPAGSARSETRTAWLVALGALAAYGLIARVVFSGRPLLIDELVQLLQAQDLARGELSHAIPGPKPFFAILNEVEVGNRAFGQYPIGGPALLALGVLVGAPWLVGPFVGAASVLLFWLVLRELEPDATPRWRIATAAWFAAAPFGAFMFGSQMNHAPTLMWGLAAAVSLARATRDGASARASYGFSLAAGLALGFAATIRPLDGVVLALPAAAWLLVRARRGLEARVALALAGVGVALPLLGLLWANRETTGAAFRFGYDLLWGTSHALGFHSTPWGAVHTPARGIELLGVYLTRLNTYLFELPWPSLMLPASGLWFARARLSALDRYLLACAGLLAVGYWAYWHDGFYLGPRFVFLWLPVLVLWSARGIRTANEMLADRAARRRGVNAALGVAAAYALVTITLVRMPSYRNDLSSMRIDPAAASRAGVRDALVLVQESWGAQLIVRLWDAGISRADAERLYQRVDACVLEETLTRIEADGARGPVALGRLAPLVRDSARLVPSDLSPDRSQRRLPGIGYTPRCIQRLEEDRAGFLLYAPWRAVQDGNVYARWLPGREAEIRAAFPGRAVYHLRRASAEVGAPLVWTPLSDSRNAR